MLRSLKLFLLVVLAASMLPGADSGLLGLVMPDAAIVIGINVARIKSSALAEPLFAGAQPGAAELRKFIDATGFDYRRDLSEVLIAAPAGKEQKRGLVLLRGAFQAARLPALATAGGAKLLGYQGVPILQFEQQGEPVAVTCLDESTAALGDLDSVRAAIARRGFTSRLDEKLLEKATELSSTLDIWFATAASLPELAGDISDQNLSGMLKGDALKGIEQASGGIKLGPQIQMSVDVATRTEKDAMALRDVLRFFAGLALTNGRRTQSKNPLDDLKVRVDGNSLKLALVIPEEEVAKMIAAQRRSMEDSRQRARAAEVKVQSAPENPGMLIIQSSPTDMGVVTIPSKQ